MAYLVTYLLLSAVGTIIALCLLAQGAKADEALEKLMSETEPVAPLNKSSLTTTAPPTKGNDNEKNFNRDIPCYYSGRTRHIKSQRCQTGATNS